jgi:hypothetical protein
MSEPISPAGYLRGLADLFQGITSTTGEIDEETGQIVGWDEPPWTVINSIELKD